MWGYLSMDKLRCRFVNYRVLSNLHFIFQFTFFYNNYMLVLLIIEYSSFSACRNYKKRRKTILINSITVKKKIMVKVYAEFDSFCVSSNTCSF